MEKLERNVRIAIKKKKNRVTMLQYNVVQIILYQISRNLYNYFL